MKKKLFTRKTPFLFTHLRKKPCPIGHFKTENDLYLAYVDWLDFFCWGHAPSQDDLYLAYVDWLDYYDPIGFVRNWGILHEYEPEARDLVQRVQRCFNAEEFAVTLRECLVEWFCEEDIKPHFWQHGVCTVAEDGWALWRRFEFDLQQISKRSHLRKNHTI